MNRSISLSPVPSVSCIKWHHSPTASRFGLCVPGRVLARRARVELASTVLVGAGAASISIWSRLYNLNQQHDFSGGPASGDGVVCLYCFRQGECLAHDDLQGAGG